MLLRRTYLFLLCVKRSIALFVPNLPRSFENQRGYELLIIYVKSKILQFRLYVFPNPGFLLKEVLLMVSCAKNHNHYFM